MITTKDLIAIAGTKSGNQVTVKIAEAFNKHAAKYGVTTPQRISQFLANVCHETGGFTKLEESLNYSVTGLLNGFGRHRISAADCEKYGRKPTRKADQKAIANILYGGVFGKENLGNTEPNDGWDYRGSGPGQVTGRANFAKVQTETGIRVLFNPDLMREPDTGMIAALMLWQKWGLNELSDKGMTTAIRKRWNGGDKGSKEVTDAYVRARGLALTVPVQEKKLPELPKVSPEVIPSPEAILEPAIDNAKAKGATAVLAGGAVVAAGGGYLLTSAHGWWVTFSTWLQGLFQ